MLPPSASAVTACAASCRKVTPTKNSAGASASCGTNSTRAAARRGAQARGCSESGDGKASRGGLARGAGRLAVPGGLCARRGAGLEVEEPEQAQVAVGADPLAADQAAEHVPRE